MAIIGILAAIAVPLYANVQARARIAKAQADTRAIASAVSIYSAHCGGLPDNGVGGHHLPDRRRPERRAPGRAPHAADERAEPGRRAVPEQLAHACRPAGRARAPRTSTPAPRPARSWSAAAATTPPPTPTAARPVRDRLAQHRGRPKSRPIRRKRRSDRRPHGRDTDGMADIAARLADARLDAPSSARCGSGATRRRRPLLTPDECAELIAMYDDDARFRSRVDMARYRFGARRVQVLRRRRCRRWCRRSARTPIRRWPRSPTSWRPRSRPRPCIRPDAGRAARALPPRRPDEADAAAAALRGRRLQLPAPGHLRRRRVSAAAHLLPQPARGGLRGRRLPAGRAAAPRAVARRGHRHRAGRDRDLRRPATGRCRAPAAGIAPPCATGSAGSLRGSRYTLGVIFHDARVIAPRVGS